jgi:hypothetical protein
MLRARHLLTAIAFAALLPGTANAASGDRPSPPPGHHDTTQPWIMRQVAGEVASAHVDGLKPRTPVVPLRPRTASPSTAATSPALKREVMGFARADSLGDPSVGFTTWNFSLLTDVAYFGISVNSDGTLVMNNTGWSVWQSATASSFISAAHAAGVRVLLTLEYLPGNAAANQAMCQAFDNGQTTINQAKAALNGADGIDIDYEGTNVGCPSPGGTLETKLDNFVKSVRAANLGGSASAPGYLVIDTYAGAPEDPGGFFDIPGLVGSVDSLFAMAYSLESSNSNPCSTCMMPTSPLDGPTYTWNVTRAANDYAPWAAQTIMGLPYYGVAGCVQGPNPQANAPVVQPSHYAGVPYVVFPTLGSNPEISSFQTARDAQDPAGQEKVGTYNDADPADNCWREAYWDDQVSLSHKFDLVNQRNFRGAGIFTLDFGGGSQELWSLLSIEFGTALGFQNLGGGFTSSPASASWGANRLDVLARGEDGALWWDFWNGTSWSGWSSLGGALTSAPAAVSWGPNRIDVFAKGTDSALWHIAWTGSSWSGWQSLGGALTEAPAVSSWASGRLDVFARSTDNGLWHIAWTGSQWTGWQGLGGALTAGPGAVSWGPNRIDVFVRGTDAALWHRAWDGTTWTSWQSLGGGMTASAPAPASTGVNELDVFIPGQDGALYHIVWNGTSWSSFMAHGPTSIWHLGPATVSQPGSGHVDTFTIGPDISIWHGVS